jgi:hypothetical protein
MHFVEKHYAELVANQLKSCLLEAWTEVAQGSNSFAAIPTRFRDGIVAHVRQGTPIPGDCLDWVEEFARREVQAQLEAHWGREAKIALDEQAGQARLLRDSQVRTEQRNDRIAAIIGWLTLPRALGLAGCSLCLFLAFRLFPVVMISDGPKGASVQIMPTEAPRMATGAKRAEREPQGPVNSAPAVEPASPTLMQSSSGTESQASIPLGASERDRAPSSGSQIIGDLGQSRSENVTPQYRAGTAAPGTADPPQIGDWKIGRLPNSKPFAVVAGMTEASLSSGDITQLRLECSDNGRLEYLVIPKEVAQIRYLAIDDPADNPRYDPVLRQSNGRVSGAAAEKITKAFLDGVAGAKRARFDGAVVVGLILNDPNRGGTQFSARGFGETHKYLLDECARIELASRSNAPIATSPPVMSAATDESITGTPTVITTAALAINGQNFTLQGVEGVSGAQADKFRTFLREQGGSISCQRAADASYRCRTATNVDLSAAVLMNGAGRALADAPPELRKAEKSARDRKAGVWGSSP